MFSLREMAAIVLAAVLFLVNAGRAVQVGASWLGLYVRWWEATLSFSVAVVLFAAAVLLVVVARERVDEKRTNDATVTLERRFPGSRATQLSSERRLLTDVASGQTIAEVAPRDFNLPS